VTQNPEPNPFEQTYVGSAETATLPLSMLQPIPVAMMSGIASGPGGNLVMLRFETLVGSFVFFADPAKVKEYALEIAATAAKAESGIILPPGARA